MILVGVLFYDMMSALIFTRRISLIQLWPINTYLPILPVPCGVR